MKSALWIVPSDIQSSIIPTPAGPLLILSSTKPMLVTVHLVVTQNDVLVTTNHTLAFSDNGPNPEPGPNPRPDPKPAFDLPPLPASLSTLAAVFKQAAAEATTIEDLQTRTTNGVVAQIGTDRYAREFLPWRNKFTEVFNSLKISDLSKAKELWNSVK